MLTNEIKIILKKENNKKNLIITIGNSFRHDDGVGPYIYLNLNKLPYDYLILNAGNNPENIIDTAISINPDKTIFIDAANFNGAPGEIKLISEDLISAFTLSTHIFPLNIISKMIEKETGSNIFFIGIQCKNLNFGEGLSNEIKKSADKIINYIKSLN